jgi:hypothetical protein
MSILLGTQFYAADGDAVRRQQQALAAMLRLQGVRLVNGQWADEIYDRPGIATLAVLRNDSRTANRRRFRPRVLGGRTRLTQARARGVDEAGELALQRDAFVFRQTVPQRVWHLGRKVRSHWRFRRQQVQWMRQAG